MSIMEIQIVRDSIQKADLKRITEEERRKRILERWQTFSLAEQLGNIGSEVARAREVFCDDALGRKEYGGSLEDLNRYFLFFACAARKNIS